MRRTISVAAGEFGLEALGGSFLRNPENLNRSIVQALRYYLADRRLGRGGWAFPDFRREDQSGSQVEVELEIDDATWRDVSAEAECQGISTAQLIQHAVLYFASDRDSGRLAMRIAEDLGSRSVSKSPGSSGSQPVRPGRNGP